MPNVVVGTATISCSMGLGPPMPLTVVPKGPPVMAGGQLVATVADTIPMVNIPTFGMCNSTTNPTVIAATSAAMGVHTPAPCVPVPVGPWSPGSSKVKMGGLSVLTDSSTCNCAFQGTISVGSAGQVKVSANG